MTSILDKKLVEETLVSQSFRVVSIWQKKDTNKQELCLLCEGLKNKNGFYNVFLKSNKKIQKVSKRNLRASSCIEELETQKFQKIYQS